jgi:hypothetical protein
MKRQIITVLFITCLFATTFLSLNINSASALSSGTPINKAAVVYGELWGSTDSTYIANNFDFLVTDFPDLGGNPTLVKTYHADIGIIGYKDLIFTRDGYADWATVNANEDWFIHTIDGHRVLRVGTTGNYLMNPTSGWNSYYSTYVNNLIASYSSYDGVFADDVWYQLSYFVSWGMLKDATTGTTLTASNFVSETLTDWNSDVLAMLQNTQSNLASGKILVANSDEGFFGSHTYLDNVNGTMVEGYIHASFEGVTSHNYLLYGNFANSLAYLQYGTDAGKIVLAESGSLVDNSALVESCYAGYLLGVEGLNGYWGWNTGYSYVVGANIHQTIMELDIGASISQSFISQNVYMRNFANGKALFNPSANSYSVNVGSGYTFINGSSATIFTLAPYSGIVLESVDVATPTPASPTPAPTASPTPVASPTIPPNPYLTPTPSPTPTPIVSTAQAATNQVFTNVYIALGIAVVSTLIAGCYIIISSFNSGSGNARFGVGLVLVSIIEVVIGVVVVNAFQGSMGTVAISLLSIKGIT